MLDFKVMLPGKLASVNKIYVRGRHGGVYLAPEVREFRDEVKPLVLAAWNALVKEKQYEGGLLNVTIDVQDQFFTKGGDVRRVDIDNFLKQTLDSIFPVIGLDDKLVFNLRARKVQYAGQPRCSVKIKEIPQTDKKSRKKL